MSGLKGDLRKIGDLKRMLRELPITVAEDVAKDAAPALTTEAQAAFSGGRTVYGEARPLGVDGRPLDLVDTGDVSRDMKFTRDGTIVRAVLGTKYARYLIGKYGVLPNGPMPADWAATIRAILKRVKPSWP